MNYKHIIDFIRSLYPEKDLIPLHEPYFAGKEKNYLLDCIDSTYVSSNGRYVELFEQRMSEFTGARSAIAAVNGTSALHIALLIAGVQAGDLVLTQSMTFIATCNAITYCGAEPVFMDIDRNTLGLSSGSLKDWLSRNSVLIEKEGRIQSYYKLESDTTPLRRISACLPMHTFGLPCTLDEILDICKQYHIPVVEDAAESLGSYYKGQHTGTLGELGIFSFNGNKTITTGGGGIIVTNDNDLAKKAKHLTTTAKIPHAWRFEHDMTGYNYRLPNINAALGCAQMEMLPQMLKGKRETALAYKEFFQTMPEIEFVSEPDGCISNYWLNAILLADSAERDRFLQQTNDHKVLTRPAWISMHELPMFRHCLRNRLPITEEISSRLVNLPSSYSARNYA